MNRVTVWSKAFRTRKIPPEEIKSSRMTFTTALLRMCGTVALPVSIPLNYGSQPERTCQVWNSPYVSRAFFPTDRRRHNHIWSSKRRLAWMTPDIKIAENRYCIFIGALRDTTSRYLASAQQGYWITQCSIYGTWWRGMVCGSALIRTGQQHINDTPKSCIHMLSLKARGAKRVSLLAPDVSGLQR